MRSLWAAGLAIILAWGSHSAEAGFFSSAPWSYTAEPIDGRVVDRETSEPIAGAVVVAQWVLAKPLEGHNVDQWIVIEAVTDEEGRYHLPGWGPKTRPWFRWLEDYDPKLVVFKPGYFQKSLVNRLPGSAGVEGFNTRGSKVRGAYWNRKDVVLWPFRIGEGIKREDLMTAYFERQPLNPNSPERFAMTQEEWARQLRSLQFAVAWGRNWASEQRWTEEDWLRVKELAIIINQECLKLPRNLRREVEAVPEEYQRSILGEIQPCGL